MDTLAQILDLARQNAGTIGLVFTWAGILWVYRRKRAEWHRKEFLGQVNFSLNYVADGRLTMRTLAEVPARDVWLNDLGVKKVNKAAEKTTLDQPFVALTDPADMAFVYRAVLNVLSEKFADAYLAQSMRLPVTFETYRFAITFERHEDMRTFKLRVLLAREDDLAGAFGPALPENRAIYSIRLQTLRAMSKLHQTAGLPGVMPLGRVVLGLRA